MTREEFNKYLNLSQSVSERGRRLYKDSIDLLEYDNDFYCIISILGESLFTKFGWDHISHYEESLDTVYTKKYPMCWNSDTGKAEYWDRDSLYDFLVRSEYISSD